MDEQAVRIAVDLTVNEGRLDEFRSVAQTMTAQTQNEDGTLGYEWFFSTDQKKCRLLETYVDASAVLAHFTGPVVQELVPKLGALCAIDSFEVYGDPGPKVTEMVAGFGAMMYQYSFGLKH